jgi:aminopeptidase N
MGVNWHHWEGSDHYYKGAWMLHTLRHAIGNDSIWWPMLKNLHLEHKNTHMTTAEIVQFFNKTSGTDWTSFFDQYLRYPRLPTLLHKTTATPTGMKLSYRWQADVAAFDMPVVLTIREQAVRIKPNTQVWQEIEFEQLSPEQFSIPSSFQLFNNRRVE